jgi:hypothetical protein
VIGRRAGATAVIIGALVLLLAAGTALASETAEPDAVFAPVDACFDDSPGCLQRRIFGYLKIIVLALGGSVAVGGLAGAWIAMVGLRREQDAGRRPRPKGRAIVVAGPVHEDGTWARMVEEDGQRRMEVLGPDGWRAVGRDPAVMMAAMRLAVRH